MSSLTRFRQSVVDALDLAGLNAHAHVPERIVPPVTFVLPRSPYVDPADGTGCGWWARLRVVLMGGKGVNATAADKLDDRIVTALDTLAGLEDPELELEAVQEPVEVELNGNTYLGTVILAAGIIELEQ